MDPLTDVAVTLKLQAALVPYRTRADEDALLDLKATKSEVSTLQTQLQTTNAAVATKANAADVYTKDTVDQRIASSITSASSNSSDATQALAQSLSSAVQTLNQNIANTQTTLTSQISGKVSMDAWPGMVLAAKADAANAANAAIAQTTQDLQAQMAAKAPLLAPSFTGPVKVNGQDVVLDNDARLSIRGPTGPAGTAGAVGSTGSPGMAGSNGAPGVTGPAGTVGPTGPAGSGGGGGGGGAFSPVLMKIESSPFVGVGAEVFLFQNITILAGTEPENFSTGSYISGGNFVTPSAGYYFISFSYMFGATSGSALMQRARSSVFVNSVLKHRNYSSTLQPHASQQSYLSDSVSLALQLAENDLVAIRIDEYISGKTLDRWRVVIYRLA